MRLVCKSCFVADVAIMLVWRTASGARLMYTNASVSCEDLAFAQVQLLAACLLMCN